MLVNTAWCHSHPVSSFPPSWKPWPFPFSRAKAAEEMAARTQQCWRAQGHQLMGKSMPHITRRRQTTLQHGLCAIHEPHISWSAHVQSSLGWWNEAKNWLIGTFPKMASTRQRIIFTPLQKWRTGVSKQLWAYPQQFHGHYYGRFSKQQQLGGSPDAWIHHDIPVLLLS